MRRGLRGPDASGRPTLPAAPLALADAGAGAGAGAGDGAVPGRGEMVVEPKRAAVTERALGGTPATAAAAPAGVRALAGADRGGAARWVAVLRP